MPRPACARRMRSICARSVAFAFVALSGAVEAQSTGSNGQSPQREQGNVTVDDEGVTLRSADGKLDVTLGGRLQLDAGGGEGRGVELHEMSLYRGRARRAWLELGFKHDQTLAGAFEVDVANRREPIRDFAIGYSGLGPFTLTLGNFKEPFSFEQLQSNNNLTFMERSLADSLVPARNFGAALGANGERWTAALGVFGGNVNDEIDGAGVAVTGRLTYAPVLDKENGRVLHLGLAGSVRETNRRASFQIEPNPESEVYDSPLIGFDAVRGVRRLTRGGIEAAFQSGPFRLQAEHMAAHVELGARDGDDRRGDAIFHGGYVHAAYMLTGESRPYQIAPDARYGVEYATFGGVDLAERDRVSRGGRGAWELAGRYSFLDLNSGSFEGGRQHNATLGLNWYPEKNVRVQANYVRAFGEDLKPENKQRSGVARVDVNIVQVRIQVAY